MANYGSWISFSVSDGTLGTQQTITITQIASYWHTLTWAASDGEYGTIATKSKGTVASDSNNTTFTFTPPKDLASVVPYGTSVLVNFTLYSYTKEGSLFSTLSESAYMSVPDTSEFQPGCSIGVSDPTGYLSTYGGYVVGKSKYQVTVTTSPAYDSPIQSYSVVANNSTYVDSSFTTNEVRSTAYNTISATVKDGRGRTGTASTSVTVLAYAAPQITKFTLARCDSSGTESDDGTYLKTVYSSVVTSLNNKNAKSYVIQYRKTGDSTWTTGATRSTYYTYTDKSDVFGDGAIADDSSYEARLLVTDSFSTSEATASVGTAFKLMHFNSSGKGMGIGAVNNDNTLKIGLHTEIASRLNVDDYAYFAAGLDSATFFGTYGGPRFYTGQCWGASGTKKWIRLGTITDSYDSMNHIFWIYSGNGYNAGAHQNTTIEIVVKDGWQSTYQIASAFGGRATIYSYNDSAANNFNYYIVATSYNSFELWIYLPWDYWNMQYIVSTLSTWTPICTNHDTLDDFTSDQMNQDSVVFMNIDGGNFNTEFATWALNLVYPVGAIYMSYKNTSPGAFLGGSWSSLSTIGTGSNSTVGTMSIHPFKYAWHRIA